MTDLVLVGLPGSGKSEVGRRLAEILGADPAAALARLARDRQRFYAAAVRVDANATVEDVSRRVIEASAARRPTTLLRAETGIGSIVLGEGLAAVEIDAALRRLGARRAILVSEPGAWSAAGERLAASVRESGWRVDEVLLPEGEAAKRLAV